MKKVLPLLLLVSCAIAAVAMTQDWAKANLAKSTRHGEWVDVKSGDRAVHAWVVYPEVKTKAPAIVVIHEIFGMSDWVQDVTDQFAELGYIAIAPDLLSGAGPNGGGTSSMDSSQIGPAIQKLPPDQITADLNAVADYATKLPSANGKLAVAGFCWGGSQTFRFATNRSTLSAALSFYGGPPATDDMKKINAKVYGFYAELDARIDATIYPGAVDNMKAAGKFYEPVTYKGAGHGFMRSGEGPAPTTPPKEGQPKYEDNQKARQDAWVRIRAILKGM